MSENERDPTIRGKIKPNKNPNTFGEYLEIMAPPLTQKAHRGCNLGSSRPQTPDRPKL